MGMQHCLKIVGKKKVLLLAKIVDELKRFYCDFSNPGVISLQNHTAVFILHSREYQNIILVRLCSYFVALI